MLVACGAPIETRPWISILHSIEKYSYIVPIYYMPNGVSWQDEEVMVLPPLTRYARFNSSGYSVKGRDMNQ